MNSKDLMGLLVSLIVLLLCAIPFSTWAATTGSVIGTVSDADGKPLPGVQILANSPNLQGSKSAVTDEKGSYRLLLLPPGLYTVEADLMGFSKIRHEELVVSLNKTIELNFSMQEMLKESITVIGESPLVDTTSTETGVNLKKEMFETLPTGRDFQQLTALVPGVSMEMADHDQDNLGNSPTVSGSSAPENNYIIDGISTTDPVYGTSGTNLAFNFVQEVEVITGGYAAEYGRSTGGLFNVITKSGGNEFHGEVFTYYQSYDINSEYLWKSEEGHETYSRGNTEYDTGASLGGYILKDRLWFFGAYDPSVKERKQIGALGQDMESEETTNYYAFKLTYRINDNHNLTASIFGDPTKDEGAFGRGNGEDSAFEKDKESGGENYSFRYNGLWGGHTVTELTVGRHTQVYKEYPLNEAGYESTELDLDNDLRYGGIYIIEDREGSRDTVGLKISHMFDALGQHTFKYGGDWEDNLYDNKTYYPGEGGYNYWYYTVGDMIRCQARHYDNFGEAHTYNKAFFAQDSWALLPSFLLNYGLRWEHQEIESAASSRAAIKLEDSWAPRAGAIWDFMDNGKSKLFASYGRFFESIPMDINMRAFGTELYDIYYYQRPNDGSGAYNPDDYDHPYPPAEESGAWDLYFHRVSDQTLNPTPVDPDLKGQYIDEFVFGSEYEVMPNASVSLKYIHRELGRVIEDGAILNDETGEIIYFIMNPGEGIGSEYPDASRKYQAIEFSINKALADNWQFLFSYTYSRCEGNYEGLYLTGGYNQLDPNITAAYDIPAMMPHSYGKLRDDRRFIFKNNGAYTFDMGDNGSIVLGGGLNIKDGSPISKMGPETAWGYGDGTIYFTDRGSEGRTPTTWALDTHFEYKFPKICLGSLETDLRLMVDIFNLTQEHRPTEVDEDWVYEGMDDYGLWADNVDADGQLIYDESLPGSPYYGSPILYQKGREVRFGAVWTF